MNQEPNLQDAYGVCVQTDLQELKLFRKGKVRDVYECADKLLLIATDRISAYDVVMPTPIPMKGIVLTQLSKFWFDMMRDIVPNHLVSLGVKDLPCQLKQLPGMLELRSMLVLKAEMFPVECVARGYVTGSGWKEYQESGTICGIKIPAGLRECDRLPEPIFTPATKAETGHDINISFEEAASRIGEDWAAKLRDLTIKIYERAAAYAYPRGIIIADTKFEFGLHDGQILLCDEVLTPDSSRFWPRTNYRPGRPQPSFDKQYVRDYLDKIRFNRQPPGPILPEAVIKGTTERYVEAYKVLTGASLE